MTMVLFRKKICMSSNHTLGFRKCRSCLDNLNHLVTIIQTDYCKNCTTIGCLIDKQTPHIITSITTIFYTY